MKNRGKRLPVAEQVRKGLEEAILHAKGEMTLKTMTLESSDASEMGAEERNAALGGKPATEPHGS